MTLSCILTFKKKLCRYLIESMQRSYLIAMNIQKNIDNNTKDTTPFNHIFGGYMRQDVTCLRCKYVSTTSQHFMDLPLDIRYKENHFIPLHYTTSQRLCSSDKWITLTPRWRATSAARTWARGRTCTSARSVTRRCRPQSSTRSSGRPSCSASSSRGSTWEARTRDTSPSPGSSTSPVTSGWRPGLVSDVGLTYLHFLDVLLQKIFPLNTNL